MRRDSAMAMIGWRLSSLLDGAIEPTEDGDFQFEAGCADILVSVDSTDGLDMLVMAARLVHRIKPRTRTSGILGALNASAVPFRVVRSEDQVLGLWVVPIETVDGKIFERVLNTFCRTVNEVAPELARACKGRTPNQIESPARDEIDA